MKHDRMSFKQALEYVRSKRAVVCPNYGFQNELKKYETILKKSAKEQETDQKEAKIDSEKKEAVRFKYQ